MKGIETRKELPPEQCEELLSRNLEISIRKRQAGCKLSLRLENSAVPLL
ncbi:MAG: hypothetical protein QOH42_1500 [Blastocatellia bacterium]|nr:hypothetical protein [Blastocatellia bacterium]